MAAALPYCDRLLPAGTFRDLADAARQLQSVTCTDGLKRPTLTPAPRIIA